MQFVLMRVRVTKSVFWIDPNRGVIESHVRLTPAILFFAMIKDAKTIKI